MIKEIKLDKYNLIAKACVMHEESEDTENHIERIVAVNIKGSISLQAMTGDFGIVVYNENMLGFFIDWKDYESLRKELNIHEEDIDFLDNITSDLIDSVINNIANH